MLRPALLVMSGLALAGVAAGLLAGGGAAAGAPASFAVDEGRGTVTIKGSGVVIGRLDHGDVLIADLSPGDQWSPRVNGVPRGKSVWTRGRSINFFVPGGRYRIVVKGEGIAISARGQGMVVLDGRPDTVGDAGTYTVGDDESQSLPDNVERVWFGGSASTKAPA